MSAGLLCSTMWCVVEYKWKRVPTLLWTDRSVPRDPCDRWWGEKRQNVKSSLQSKRRVRVVPGVGLCRQYNCFTIPVWRQWLWSGGGWLTLQFWSINWARSAPSSGSLQLGPAPDLGSLGSTVTSGASRRQGKPRKRTSGYFTPNLADFPRKSSTRVFCN